MNSSVKTKKLNEMAEIPLLGFGTWQLKGNNCSNSVAHALKTGYRHIDTADYYQNHEDVGKAIQSSGIPRDQIFLTTKIWRTDLKPEDVEKNTKRFLDELQTDYIDLLLIHWPNNDLSILETLKAMKKLKTDRKINSIGVSNFTIKLLKNLFKNSKEIIDKDLSIDNNQIELHPSLQQKDLVEYCFKNDITVTAYSPLGRGKDLDVDEIKEIANAHDCNESQVILAWMRQSGIIAIPKSGDPVHIDDNFHSLEIKLEKDELKIMNGLDRENRLINPSFALFSD